MVEVNSAHPGLAVIGVFVHLLLTGACIVAWARDRRSRWVSRSWLIFSGFELFFALDAGLGIRLRIAEVGREYFLRHGWYAHRRPFQALLVLWAVVLVSLVTYSFIKVKRNISTGCRTAAFGTAVLFVIFLNASISLHQTEKFKLAAAGRVLGCGLTGFGAYLGATEDP